MIRRLVSIVAILTAFSGAVAFVSPQPAYASTLLGDVCSGAGANSAACKDAKKGGSDPVTGNNGAIMKIVNIVAIVTGVAAVIIIIVSGFQLITAGGDAQEVAKARQSVVYALVGLVVVVMARQIISFVLSRI